MLDSNRPVGFHTVLVANRGEIAVRIIDTLGSMNIRSIAVYSDADADARHVHDADSAVRLGPAPARDSYLNIDAVVDAAVRTGAGAVHPGYGFLSENPAFASALAEAGIVFLGPPAKAIEVMGDKIAAKTTVSTSGVPVVPGIAEPGLDDTALITAAVDIGFPILIKPSAGGGGKGMRLVTEPGQLPDALRSARREATAGFGDDTLFLERFVSRPRHIEVQVLADQHGNVVHLGERECSLQRRHQKVIEEAPSPLLDDATRARIGAAACATARSVDYVGAGTVEFIVSAEQPDEFFFMEMNTRLQVEHPVTEMVTGYDLVECQIRIADGQPITAVQDDIAVTGHAIEARVYAEDPQRSFLPTGGTVLALSEPAGPGVRVDSGMRTGTIVGSDYDPMLAKVIAYAADRPGAMRNLDRALADTVVLGVTTNIEFLRFLLTDPDVIAGRLDTGLLDHRSGDFEPHPIPDAAFVAAACYYWLQLWPNTPASLWEIPSGWRLGTTAPISFRLAAGQRIEQVQLTGSPVSAEARVGDGETVPISVTNPGPHRLTLCYNGFRNTYRVAEYNDRLWLAGPSGTAVLHELAEPSVRGARTELGEAEIRSPMPGSVIAVAADSGAEVAAGAPIVVVEAMKMEHSLTAPTTGTVEILVAPGAQVGIDQVLARVHPQPATTPATTDRPRPDETHREANQP